MVNYIIGDTIQAVADVSLDIGRSVAEYEWKWDSAIIGGSIDEILYETLNETEGFHILSLKILNDCGNWSQRDTETVNLIKPLGNIEVNTEYEQGEQVVVNWAGVNFTGGILYIVDPLVAVKYQLIVNAPVGTLRYTLPNGAQLGTWSVILDYESQGVDYKNFSVVALCPIPSVEIVFQ